MSENLNIISNEKISLQNDGFFCDNIDLKSIPEGLGKHFNLTLIARKALGKKSHNIKINKIKLGKNIFIFLFKIFSVLKYKKSKYLIISITPYTFFAFCLLLLFGKKPYVYLRSSGHEEYKYIAGFLGAILYSLMFNFVSLRSELISCNSRILMGKKGKTVSPSQLNSNWLKPIEKNNLDKVRLLYVGRIKVEKGIFSLLKIIKNLDMEFEFTIISAGEKNDKFFSQKNIKFLNFENKNDSIIKVYDEHNIFILPSYTEGHPQVLDEALARKKPVIIFDEIKHVIGNRKGVFISKREIINLKETIQYIMKNYIAIQTEMEKNKLPNKELFLKEMETIIKN